MKRVKSECQKLKIDLKILDSPMFLNTSGDLEQYFKTTKKKLYQTEFYKQERINRKILIDVSGGPEGGQWTFDIENRKKYPKNKAVVAVKFPPIDSYIQESHDYTNQYFSNNIGQLSEVFTYPIGYQASEEWLNQFLKNRMAKFGDYEDAILKNEILLNHSLLSPMLNTGILSPEQIINQILKFSKENGIPINSLEGLE